MAAIDILQKQWQEEAQFKPFRPYLHIDDDGLSLGAGSLIAPMRRDAAGAPCLALDGEEERLLALLSLGFRTPLPITALKFIKRASMQWAKGEKALAHFELAYARLPRFETRDDAKHLFFADGFLRLGISPRALMRVHGLDTRQLDLLKYSADQPRVPAGNPAGGQWTPANAATAPGNQGVSRPASDRHPTSSDIQVASNDRKRTKIPEWERRALGLPPDYVDLEPGQAVPLQTPLVEESDPTGVGRHAGESIPARSPARNFTVKERQEINRIGRETGCHSCGTKEPGTVRGNFVPDHQPPSGLNSSGKPQRLYPHCLTCSNNQGGSIMRQRWRKHK